MITSEITVIARWVISALIVAAAVIFFVYVGMSVAKEGGINGALIEAGIYAKDIVNAVTEHKAGD